MMFSYALLYGIISLFFLFLNAYQLLLDYRFPNKHPFLVLFWHKILSAAALCLACTSLIWGFDSYTESYATFYVGDGLVSLANTIIMSGYIYLCYHMLSSAVQVSRLMYSGVTVSAKTIQFAFFGVFLCYGFVQIQSFVVAVTLDVF